MSRDLEDILLVVDGRKELLAEVLKADLGVRDFIAGEIRALQDHYDYDNFLEGNVRGPEGRVDIVRDRLDALARQDGEG